VKKESISLKVFIAFIGDIYHNSLKQDITLSWTSWPTSTRNEY
jgi:hypothetical protein